MKHLRNYKLFESTIFNNILGKLKQTLGHRVSLCWNLLFQIHHLLSVDFPM